MRKLQPPFRSIDARAVQPPAKTADPIYRLPEYREWREMVIRRAGRRCQATTVDGRRCSKQEPYHRMFADHVVEIRDGGAMYDPANGMCLCGQHHTIKTYRARADRMRR